MAYQKKERAPREDRGDFVPRRRPAIPANDKIDLNDIEVLRRYVTEYGKIIRENNPEGKTVFATSSYHVFRSGLWAKQAGLSAEGIGSRTKWWFWPNAFIRETAGLLQKRWKQELLFLLLLLVFFGSLSMVL